MRNLKIILMLVMIAAFTTNAGATEFDASEFVIKNSKNSLVQSDFNRYDFEVLDTKAKAIFNTDARQIQINNFPIRPDYSVNLVLTRQSSAFTKDVKIRTFKKGKEVEYKQLSKAKYHGFIEGDEKSDVFISYSSVGLVGYIQDATGQMYDVSSNLTKLGGEKVPHSVSETTKGQTDMVCGVDDYTNFHPELNELVIEKPNEITQTNEIYEAKIAVDGNFEYYLLFAHYVTGNSKSNWESWFLDLTEEEVNTTIERALDNIDNVMAAVARIYARETAVLIRVGDVTLYSDPQLDPYFSVFGETLQIKLNAMPKIWNSKDYAKDRVLATVFTDLGRQPSGNTAGIAMSDYYKSSLCNTNIGYSALGSRGNITFPRLTYSGDVTDAAHEFGHNFGCPHTHFCSWPLLGETLIDSCVVLNQAQDSDCLKATDRRIRLDGTIMSYCHIGGGVELRFHPRMRDRIRKFSKANLKSCVKQPTEPVVVLVRPIGLESYSAGIPATISFIAANVSDAKLFYSDDLGKNWTEIGIANATEDTLYTWNIPDEVGTKYMVRIESATDPTVFDQSELPFNVVNNSIAPVFPQIGQKVGYLNKQDISWVRKNVGEVIVKLSTDNGENFTEIDDGNISQILNYDFPDVATDKAILLIESKENPAVNISIPFILGKESVEFTNPMLNDTVNVNFKKHKVRFSTDFVNKEFDILYRANQSGEWRKVTKFNDKVDIENNEYEWTFDASIVSGQLGELRAQIEGEETVIGESGLFYFDALSSVSKSYFDGFTIKSITPNPASSTFAITVNNSKNYLVKTTIMIVGTDGKLHQTISDKHFGTGVSSPLEIDISKLQVGTYFVIIESDKHKDVQQLKVVR